MRFVADECVDQQIVDALRESGYSVKYIKEISRRIRDEEVIALAETDNAILLTLDKDFGELIYRQRKSNNGVILIRLHGLKPTSKARVVVSAVEDKGKEMEGFFTVISPNLIRIRTID